LEKVIFPDLERGRLGWDLPHTKAVVYWMGELLEEVRLDPKVMIAASYAHDWGYIDLFPEKTTYETIQKMKPLHMERGAEKIEKLLRESLSDEFSQKQIERVTHLVAVHDKLGQLKDEDEILLMEADTLGALDVERVAPTFSKEDNARYVEESIMRRRPLFTHLKAIEAFDNLIQKRRDYFG
jgi:HD superfamily phosphodiesterase